MRRSARAADNVVVNVHVHNEIASPGDSGATKRRSERSMEIPRPAFRGTLYSWRDHYQPIVQRLAPIVAEREKSSRGGTRVRRLCLLAMLIVAVAAVGCGLF